MKRIYNVERWCMDCKLCEIACETAHSLSGDIVKSHKFEKVRPVSRVRVEGDLQRSMAVQCRHCEDPKCVSACITGAMSKDPETGMVSVDAQRCIGCLTCVAACPFGCVHPATAGTTVIKCDMCIDRVGGEKGVPACVEACPNRALLMVESEEVADAS